MQHVLRSGPVDIQFAVEEGCRIARRWGLDVDFAIRLARAFQEIRMFTAQTEVSVISGLRSRTLQESLEGGAPFDVSTHADRDRNGCPRLSTGADIRVGIFATANVKALVGSALVRAGLRWGGGSPVDPETGIPSDWNHVDTGRRAI